jgi:serine O-acetyltransferase
MTGRQTAARGQPAPGLRDTISEDIAAMAEGETLSRIRVVLRLAVHARWRAVVGWRIAQSCMRHTALRPVALLLSDRILAASGAELRPSSRIGPGVVLKHTTGIVVGGEVVAGRRLTLHQNVTILDRRPYGGQPTLGDDVTIGAGACVLGPISIGDRAVVAANAVVLDDVPADCVVAGAPARIVSRFDGQPVGASTAYALSPYVTIPVGLAPAEAAPHDRTPDP